MKLLHTEDATAELADQAAATDQQDAAAGDRYRAKRPNFNFEEMGIPIGAQLLSTASDAVVTVIGPRKVRLADEDMFLTPATRKVLGLAYDVTPGPYWTYEGRLLSDIYNETYPDA